ncbi:MAG: HrcA family transcriptional regulator, partial [Gemmatimonadota bacterium]
HQLHQVPGGLEEWLSLTATLLSAAVGNAAVVTRPRAISSRLRHAQLVELSRDTALLVAVMDDGRVRQRLLPQTQPATQAALQERAARLNERLEGADLTIVRALIDDLDDADELATVRAIADLIDEQRIAEETFVDGVSSVLRQPEFSDVERMLAAVAHLEAYRLRTLLETAADPSIGSTRVLIGSEHDDESMQDWSVVVARYGDQETSGTVAVVGPTRMAYGRTIPRVRYVASLMSQLLHDVRQS